MALIKCPECGKEISDKAKNCIHCGRILTENYENKENIKCNECGTVLAKTDKICPNCGCPVETQVNNQVKPQQVEVTSIKMAKKTKTLIVGGIIAIILCILGGIGYKVYSEKKAEQEYQKEYNEYISNLDEIQTLMLTGCIEAEPLCNLTLKVWGNAISKESDDETDKYTKDDYFFVDFNTAIANLHSDPSIKSIISNIELNQLYVKDLIKKLQNPPEGLEKCYDTVSDLKRNISNINRFSSKSIWKLPKLWTE